MPSNGRYEHTHTAERKKKKDRNIWQFFLRQLLALVVVIVYGFGRHFLFSLFSHFSFFLSFFLAFLTAKERSLLSIDLSIDFLLSIVLFSLFLVFFLLLPYNKNWHEKLEMTEKRRECRWRHFFSCFFLRDFFFFSASKKTYQIYILLVD